MPVRSNTQSSAASTVAGTPPLAQTFCSLSSAENTLPSYQNERFIASPDTSPTSLSGRRSAARRMLVSCRRGLCSGTSSYSFLGLERKRLDSSQALAHLAHEGVRARVDETCARIEFRLNARWRRFGSQRHRVCARDNPSPLQRAEVAGRRYRVIEAHHYRAATRVAACVGAAASAGFENGMYLTVICSILPLNLNGALS